MDTATMLNFFEESSQPLLLLASRILRCDRMPLDIICQYEKAILNSIKPELLQAHLEKKEKGELTNERKMEARFFLKRK